MATFLDEATITGVAPVVAGKPPSSGVFLDEAAITGIDPFETSARKTQTFSAAVKDVAQGMGERLLGSGLAVADMVVGGPASLVGWAKGVGGALVSAAAGQPDALKALDDTELPVVKIGGKEMKLEYLKTPLQSLRQLLTGGEAVDQSAVTAVIDGAAKQGERLGVPAEITRSTLNGAMSFAGVAGLHTGGAALGKKLGEAGVKPPAALETTSPSVAERIGGTAYEPGPPAPVELKARQAAIDAKLKEAKAAQKAVGKHLDTATSLRAAAEKLPDEDPMKTLLQEKADLSMDQAQAARDSAVKAQTDAATAKEAAQAERLGGTAYEPGKPQLVQQSPGEAHRAVMAVRDIALKDAPMRTVEEQQILMAARRNGLQRGFITPEQGVKLAAIFGGVTLGGIAVTKAYKLLDPEGYEDWRQRMRKTLGVKFDGEPDYKMIFPEAPGTQDRMPEGETPRMFYTKDEIGPALGVGLALAGAIKAKGGMWHPEAVTRLAQPLTDAAARGVGDGPRANLDSMAAAQAPIVAWGEKSVRNYLNKHAGTEGDPLAKVELPSGKTWGEVTDSLIRSRPAREFQAPQPGEHSNFPRTTASFAEGAKPGEPIWGLQRGHSDAAIHASEQELTGYLSHVGDYLRQNVDPAKLGQYDLVRAVKETAANDTRVAREMEKAAAASMKDMPVYKDYGDGMKWVELKLPEKLTEEQAARVRSTTTEEYKQGGSAGNREYVALDAAGKPIQNAYTGAPAMAANPHEAHLAGQLAQEGNQMGHCVGGYCADVASGQTRILSLRDAKGGSHVTVELAKPTDADLTRFYYSPEGEALRNRVTRPTNDLNNAIRKFDRTIEESPEYQHWKVNQPDSILQIKGKQNRAPDAKYLPYVQDLVKKGKWGEVGDLHNTGLHKWGDKYFTPDEVAKMPEAEYDAYSARNVPGQRGGPGGQRGSVDPKLLAKLAAISGSAAIAAYLNPQNWEMAGLAGAGVGALITGMRPRAIAAQIKAASAASKLVKIDDLTNATLAARQKAGRAAYQLTSRAIALVPKESRRQAIYDHLDGLPTLLSPVEKQVAGQIRSGFDALAAVAKDSGVIREVLDNYATRIYGPKGRDWLSSRGGPNMSEASPFGKHRAYATREAAAAAGWIPLTTDVAKVYDAYAQSITNALENRGYIATLKNTLTPDGAPLIAKEGKAPPSYAFIDHPQLRGFRVHPDIVGDLKMLFDKTDPGAILQTLDTINGVQKRLAVTFSMFHPIALEHAMLGATPLLKSPGLLVRSLAQSLRPRGVALVGGGVLGALSSDEHQGLAMLAGAAAGGMLGKLLPAKLFGEFSAIKQLREGPAGDVVDKLLDGGLKVSFERAEPSLEDIRSNFYQVSQGLSGYLDRAVPQLGKQTVGRITELNHEFDAFMWGRLQAGLKITVGQISAERLMRNAAARGMKLPEKEVYARAASFSNDIFGGLDYMRIVQEFGSRWGREVASAMLGPTGRMIGRLGLFAVDWTISTTRAFVKAFGKGGVTAAGGALLGSQMAPDDKLVGGALGAVAGLGAAKALGLKFGEGSGLRGLVQPVELADLHRQYILRSAFIYTALADPINLALSGHHIWENKDPTRIDLGDGRTMQASKHMMEPYHWILDPRKQGMNKASFLVKETAAQLGDVEYLSPGGAPRMGGTLRGEEVTLGARAKHLAKAFSPISVQQSIEGSGTSGLAGMLGSPIYGRTTAQRQAEQARLKALHASPEWKAKHPKKKK